MKNPTPSQELFYSCAERNLMLTVSYKFIMIVKGQKCPIKTFERIVKINKDFEAPLFFGCPYNEEFIDVDFIYGCWLIHKFWGEIFKGCEPKNMSRKFVEVFAPFIRKIGSWLPFCRPEHILKYPIKRMLEHPDNQLCIRTSDVPSEEVISRTTKEISLLAKYPHCTRSQKLYLLDRGETLSFLKFHSTVDNLYYVDSLAAKNTPDDVIYTILEFIGVNFKYRGLLDSYLNFKTERQRSLLLECIACRSYALIHLVIRHPRSIRCISFREAIHSEVARNKLLKKF